MTCKSVQLISSMVLGVTHKTTKQEADTTQNTRTSGRVCHLIQWTEGCVSLPVHTVGYTAQLHSYSLRQTACSIIS